MSLVIRAYVPKDTGAVVRIFVRWNRAIAPAGAEARFEDYIQRTLAEELLRIRDYYQRRPGSGFWVGVLDGAVVGTIGIERLSDETAEVRRMYVDEIYRRRGFGSALLAHGEAFCIATGYRRIELSTSELQPMAMALYEARGYRLVRSVTATEQTNRTVGGGIRRFHFLKPLDRKNRVLDFAPVARAESRPANASPR